MKITVTQTDSFSPNVLIRDSVEKSRTLHWDPCVAPSRVYIIRYHHHLQFNPKGPCFQRVTTRNRVKKVAYLSELANFNWILIKLNPVNKVPFSANEKSLAVIQISNTLGVLFLFSRHIIQIELLTRALSSFILTRENTYHF